MFGHRDHAVMKVGFAGPVTHIVRPAEEVTLSEVSVIRMIDIPGEKRVLVQTRELGEIVVWEGAAYDEIGQWTDLDVHNRLIEILTA